MDYLYKDFPIETNAGTAIIIKAATITALLVRIEVHPSSF